MKEDIDKATEVAFSKLYWNPREIEKGPSRELIRRCWAGASRLLQSRIITEEHKGKKSPSCRL